jgi:MFS family permease
MPIKIFGSYSPPAACGCSSYGFLSVILALYLSEIGLSAGQIGLLFTFTLAGDAVITLWLTTTADAFGRQRTLLIGALLMMFAGIVFIVTDNILILIAAAIIGVLSPSGNEIGPFLSVEQAAFTQLLPDAAHPGVRLVQPGGPSRPRWAPGERWTRSGFNGKWINRAGCLSDRFDGLRRGGFIYLRCSSCFRRKLR